jgi:His-Xaa-Ser system protein HxsD
MKFFPETNMLVLELNRELYNEATLYKCFYWYTGKYQLSIALADETWWKVRLFLGDEHLSNFEIDSLQRKLMQDLIDFKLRDIVNNETRIIRELIVAKAFANYDDEDADPMTQVSDPVGFNPE